MPLTNRDILGNTFHYKVIFFVLLAGMIFLDLPSQQLVGSIARTPIVFIAPITFATLVIIDREYNIIGFSQLYLKYWIVSFLVAVFILLYTWIFITGKFPVMYGQSAIGKLIKASSYNFFIFLFSYCLLSSADKISLTFIYKVIRFIFFLLMMLAAFEYFKIYAFHEIHTALPEGHYSNNRLRLSASEPSLAAPLFATVSISFILLRYYLKKSSSLTILYAALSMLVFIGIASKSALLIAVAFVWAIRKHISLKILVIGLLVIVPIVAFTINIVIPLLQTDIEEFNSTSTRLTTATAAFYSLIKYPLGEGYGTYLYFFPKLIMPVYNWLVYTTGIPFLSTELDEMVNTGEFLIPKSGVASEIMYNGWIAVVMLIVLINYISTLFKAINDKILYILLSLVLSYLCLSLLISVSIETSYFFVLPICLLKKMNDNSELENRMNDQVC